MMPATDRPLEGQIALVTGGARRLGREVALALADGGVGVLVHYRRSDAEAEALVGRIRGAGGSAWSVLADLGDPDAAAGLVAAAAGIAGRPIDILVNSASIFAPSGVLDFSPEDLAANLQINALSPLALARGLAAQDRAGQIVNFLDARIVEYDRSHAAYHLSKRMLHSLTRMLALELAPRIRVNAVAPGIVLPPAGAEEGYLDRLAQRVPLRRHGSAADVVRAVLFLLESSFVTGQVIYLDGGQNLLSNTYGT